MQATFSDEQILSELERVLSSAAFESSRRLRSFLDYAVRESLAGRTRNLSGYVIGIEVFDRAPDFDPQTDTLVRVSASKLRRRLAHYYAGEGKANPIRISLPLGNYRIKAEAAEDGDPTGYRPTLSIASVDCQSTHPEHRLFSLGLSSELCRQLAEFGRFVVVSPQADEIRQLTGCANLSGKPSASDLLLLSDLSWSAERLRVGAQLVQSHNHRVLRSATKEFRFAPADRLDLQVEIARHLAQQTLAAAALRQPAERSATAHPQRYADARG